MNRWTILSFFFAATVLSACIRGDQKAPLSDFSIQVYQYIGEDSTHKTIAKTIVYKYGKVSSETYLGFRTGSRTGYMDGSYYYFYRDTMLIKRQGYTEFDHDSVKSIYSHNSNGSIVTEVRYEFSRPIKKTSKGRDNLSEDDHEAIGTWTKREEFRYTHDERGRKASRITILDSTRPRRCIWSYDGKNRIIACDNYVGEQLESKEEYTYAKNSILYKTIDLEFGTSYQTERTADDFGHILSEVTTFSNRSIHSVKNTYNQAGHVIKSVIFDSQDSTTITHLFEYKIPTKTQ